MKTQLEILNLYGQKVLIRNLQAEIGKALRLKDATADNLNSPHAPTNVQRKVYWNDMYLKLMAIKTDLVIKEMPNEYIGHEENDQDSWICICGNTPPYGGFHSCNIDGVEIEPTTENGWDDLYLCGYCGRIIRGSDRKIRGQTNLSPN